MKPKLKEKMQELGIGSSELARRIEASPQAVNNWMTAREPSASKAIAIAQALGVAAEEIDWQPKKD